VRASVHPPQIRFAYISWILSALGFFINWLIFLMLWVAAGRLTVRAAPLAALVRVGFH
jgi:hypothetical protein